MVTDHGLSVREACRAARLARSAYYAPAKPRDDSAEIDAIQAYIAEVRRMTADWLTRYNEQRPHESLGNLTPKEYLMAKYP
jgi:hypothetical protein